jgi:hypothetical protein
MGLRGPVLYKMECKRFDKVMKNASDEELFMVLRYAIAHNYVPNTLWIDPYYDIHVEAGFWQRSLRVYGSVAHRKDLLQQLYPDLDVLDDYVRWDVGEPYPDSVVTQTIKRNAQGDGQSLDSMMGDWEDKNSLFYQYFATPYLWLGY